MSTQLSSHQAPSQLLLLLALTVLLPLSSCYPPAPLPVDDDDSAGDDDDSAGDDDDSAEEETTIWLADVTIVDGNGQQDHKHIGIGENGTILAIVDQRPEGSSAVVLDEYEGHVVIPGLIDSFARLSETGSTMFSGDHVLEHLSANLAMGITTVVDIGGPGWMFELRDRIEAGDIRGPRILATGALLTQAKNYPCELTYRSDTCEFLDTGSQANSASELILERTPAALNPVYSSRTVLGDFTFQNMAPAIGDAVRLQARAANPRVPLNLYISDPDDMILVTAGVSPGEDDISSLQLPFVQAWGPTFNNWSTLSEIFSHSGTGVFSTLAVAQLKQHLLHSGGINQSWLAKTVPQSVQDDWDLQYDDPVGTPPEIDDWILNSTPATGQWHDNLKRNLLTLQSEAPDVAIVAGSGAGNLFVPHGFGLHLELQLLVELWSDSTFTDNPALNTETPQMKALKAATSGAAEALGLGDEIGTIEVGKRADLVVLAKGLNPLVDIATTRNAVLVFLAGEPFNPNDYALDASTAAEMVTQAQPNTADEACFVQQDCPGGWACDLLSHECQPACNWVGDFGACGPTAYCSPADGLSFEETCDDEVDNGLDSLLDCQDPDCVESPACFEPRGNTSPETRVTVCRKAREESEPNCTLYGLNASAPASDCPQASNYSIRCVPADLDTNVCVEAGAGLAREFCMPSPPRAGTLEDSASCQRWLFCSGYDDSICLTLCDPDPISTVNPCETGEVCRDYGDLRPESPNPWYGLCSPPGAR